ncbi:2Fe-2S iron-sulfur cluster-binding protein [Paracoccus sp. 22332]|uniref:2Fe-2S iron-sulfur cluster-binding protein n=1 Tax=Paracoccus sp. 22332 TaxID=3453913 RepID=UPI003F842E1B
MNDLPPPFEIETFELDCIAARQETPTVKTYVFRLPPGALTFEPGQFMNFVFPLGGEDHARSYSISSSALTAGLVSITVKKVPGGLVSNWLFDKMSPGMRVRASGPAGSFCCGLPPRGPVLLLTAGSGITPAASMLRSLADHGSAADLVLIHFASAPEEMIFADEMRTWARALPGLRVIPVVTRHQPGAGWVGPVGRLSAPLLQGLVPDLASRMVYCCGPAGFMDLAGRLTAELGLPAGQFLTESFDRLSADDPAPADAAAPAFHATFARAGIEGLVTSDTTLLKAAKAMGVRIQSSCGKGVCGTCRVKLISGTVDLRHQGGIKQREIDQGFILACCSRPTSDVVIDK